MTNRIWHENKSKLKKSYFQNVRKIYGKETVFFFFLNESCGIIFVYGKKWN